MSKAAILADLRTILRHLKKLPSNGGNSFKDQAVVEFRANMAISDKGEARNLRWKAHDAARLIAGLRVRKVSRVSTPAWTCMKLRPREGATGRPRWRKDDTRRENQVDRPSGWFQHAVGVPGG